MYDRSTDPIFESLTIKHLTIKNRIMSTSHACGLGDQDHMPGETYQRYHLEKARGGLGLTMFGGSSYVDGDSLWSGAQLNIAHDKVIPYLQQFAERIHSEGAAIMIQITHLGRRAETNTQNWMPTVAPSPVREIGHRSIPREMDEDDINRIVRAMGDAAVRAKEGGLDGLETMTHGHLIGQFFSEATNKRTDRFGGSLENRCRFGLMIYEEIRRRTGDDFLVGMRMGIDESASGGSNFDESLEIAQIFQREGLVDFLNVNHGRIDTELALANDCMPGMAMPSAPWLARAGAFKAEVDVPVFHAAKIADIATARYALNEGLIDMVAMTRAHIADPHIVRKIAEGREDRIRPCIGASHCMSENRPTCLHNPAAGRERYWPHEIEATRGTLRNVVVVGGGPAGLDAARISAQRGHSVTLIEASNALGGQLRLAKAVGWRKDLASLVDWRERELTHLGVDVRLNTYAEAEDIRALDPDVVVIATGGVPGDGWLDGAEHCTDPWDVISGTAKATGRTLIYDGTGRHTAPVIADRIKASVDDLMYVTVDEVLAKELAYAERVIWRKRFAELAIKPVTESTLLSVQPHGNALAATYVNELTGETTEVEADTVIVEAGTIPVVDVFDDLRPTASNNGQLDMRAFVAGNPQPTLDEPGFALFRIGDAVSSRNVPAATFDALRLCSVL